MKTWRIRAHGCIEHTAPDSPPALDEPLRALVAKPPRRINRYIRLALIGAHRCAANLAGPLPASTPLYIASEQGSVADTVALLDEIIRHGRSPKPMSFINVSSNMVGFYLAATLGLSGRNTNVARNRGAFGAMLELASLDPDLDLQPETLLLLGAVAECVWPLAEHRLRCQLPADAPLVEASYWLAVDDEPDDHAPRLGYATTQDVAEARAWLAAGQHWAIDPQLPQAQRRALGAALAQRQAWPAPLCHRGHPDAIVHALFCALQSRPVPRLHAVAADPSCGFQLLGVW